MMQNMAGSTPQPDSRNDHYFSVVSDLMSLVEHIQASMKMLETAIAWELPAGDPEAYEDVVVLDDVTPCYMKANAALHACQAGLGSALHCLLDAETSEYGADGFAGRDRSPAGVALAADISGRLSISR
jgi:hypothetical protein